MRADQVASLYLDLEAQGIELWLMGGWGIDALLGRQSREHHDMDVLVEVRGLERLVQRLHHLGFEFKYLWDDETWWVNDVSWAGAETLPTAFVYGCDDGREIDVHIVRSEQCGRVTTLWTAPYEMTAAGLSGRGAVGGHAVRCLTACMQQVAHTGYELPPRHAADLRLLSEAPDIANPS